jgi:hypothetical protein
MKRRYLIIIFTSNTTSIYLNYCLIIATKRNFIPNKIKGLFGSNGREGRGGNLMEGRGREGRGGEVF